MGDGVCDDLAMIYVGAQHGYDAMLGAFVMDAIDTYDKYLLDLTWGGFDTAPGPAHPAAFPGPGGSAPGATTGRSST